VFVDVRIPVDLGAGNNLECVSGLNQIARGGVRDEFNVETAIGVGTKIVIRKWKKEF
jgi:hypothetical protein